MQSSAHTSSLPARYLRPGWFTRNLLNRSLSRLTRLGVSVAGSRVLEVPGRRTGVVRSTIVNLLELDGERYLVAPRGHTEWVRNVRAAGGCTLRVGRRRDAVAVTELGDDEKAPVLRAYLRRWKWEVGMFFEDLHTDSPDERVHEVAAGFPVFRLARS